MSSTGRPPRRPAGSGYAHPRSVYWRRRLVLLAVLCLAIWGVAKLASGGDGGEVGRGAADQTPASPTSEKPADEGRAKKGGAAATAAESGVVPVSFPAPKGDCKPAKVQVDPAVPSKTPAGSPVTVTLTFATTAKKACTLEVSQQNLLLQVESEDGTVWESTACGEVPAETITLRPKWARTLDYTWDASSCESSQERLPPGDYTVRAAVLGGEPGAAPLTLSEPREPKKKGGDKRAADGEKRSEADKSEPSASEPTESEPTASEPSASEPTESEPTASEPTSSE